MKLTSNLLAIKSWLMLIWYMALTIYFVFNAQMEMQHTQDKQLNSIITESNCPQNVLQV